MHIIQFPLFDFEAFIANKSNDRLVLVLEALPAENLITSLMRENWTGRKGYSTRGMWSTLLAGVLNQCNSLSQVVRLLKRDREVRLVYGFSQDDIPSEDALGRFLKKLVKHEDLVEKCFTSLVERLRELLPGFGDKLVVDSTEIKAYSNGHRKHPSDSDAHWGAKGASQHTPKEAAKRNGRDLYWWFGYKLHLVVDALYELPVSFVVTPANESDTNQMKPLLNKAVPDKPKRKPKAIIADKGYDSKENCRLIFKDSPRRFILKDYHAAPVIPMVERPTTQMPDICNAKGSP